MRPSPRRTALAFVALTYLSLGCGDDPNAPPAVGAIDLRGPVGYQVGDTATLVVDLTDTRGRPLAGVAVRWEVEPDSVLRVDAGKLTALREGPARIVASAGGRSDVLDVVVRFRAGIPELLSVTPTHGVAVVGERLVLDAHVRDRGGARVDTATVRWSIDDPSLAVVDAGGNVIAMRPGIATVTVAVDTMRASARLVVVPRVASVRLSPDTLPVDAAGTGAFAVDVQDASGGTLAGRVATWRSLDPGVATVDAGGRVSVMGAPGSSARIVVTVEGVSDTAVATRPVGANAAADVFPQSSVIRVGGSTTLAGRLLTTSGIATTGVAGTWRSQDPAIATVSSTGVVTGHAPGATQVLFESSGLLGRHWVKVEGEPVAAELLADTLRTATGFAFFGSELPVRLVDATGQQVTTYPIAWRADDPAVVVVRTDVGGPAGVVQAAAVGTTVLRGRVGTVDVALPVRVLASPTGTIGLDPGAIMAVVNTAIPLRVGNNGGVSQTITFATSDPRVATVSPTSATTGADGWVTVTVLATGPGSATIRAMAANSITSASITAMYPAVASVRITNPPGTVRAGNEYALRAEVREANGGATQPWMPVWRSLATGVATVAHDGTLRALAPGVASIVASLGDRADTIAVDVQPLSAPTIAAITPAVLVPGTTATIDGAGFDAAAGGNRVTIAGVPVTVTAATATRMTVQLPSAASFPCSATRPVRVLVTAGGMTGDTLHPLRAARQQELLPVGQSVLLDGREATCIELAPGATRWLATITSAGTSVSQRSTLRIWGEPSTIGAGGEPALALAASSGLALPVTSGGGVLRPDAAWRTRAELRHREALRVAPAMLRRAGPAGLRAASAGTRANAAAPLPGAGTVAVALAQPKPGAIVTMRVPLFTVSDYCSSYAEVKARVVMVGARSVLLEDVDAPIARQMDVELASLAAEVDQVMMDPATLMVGDPLKLDATRGGTGRVAVLVTRALDDFGASNEVIGSGCDLVTRAQAPASNEMPVLYMTAPRDAARGYGSADTRDYWLWVLRGRVMHELAHLAMYAERFSRGLSADEYWLDEALANVAMESYARRLSASPWKGGATYATTLGCEVRPNTPSCGGRPIAMYDLFAWLHDYGMNSRSRSPIGQAFNGDGAFLGGGWWLLRWAIDQYASDERAFVQALVNEPSLAGMANLRARTGRPSGEMLADFGGTLLAPSIAPLQPARAQMTVKTWNWSEVWRGMASDFDAFGALPLSLHYYDRTSFDSGPFTLPGGTVETVDLRGIRAMPQLMAITGANGAPAPAGLLVQLFRAQ